MDSSERGGLGWGKDLRNKQTCVYPLPSTLYPMIPPTPAFTICNYQMPLAVYREVAAHLQQIAGISVTFLEPSDRAFSYLESQLGGLEIRGADRLTESDLQQLERVLSYYAERYDEWDIDRQSI